MFNRLPFNRIRYNIVVRVGVEIHEEIHLEIERLIDIDFRSEVSRNVEIERYTSKIDLELEREKYEDVKIKKKLDEIEVEMEKEREYNKKIDIDFIYNSRVEKSRDRKIDMQIEINRDVVIYRKTETSSDINIEDEREGNISGSAFKVNV